jgi:hypothetical protein
MDWGAAARSLGMTRGEVLSAERPLEAMVREHIRRMPFLWLAVDDVAGPHSHRGVIERNAIALLSNHLKAAIDQPSPYWLGNHCNRERVRLSNLWNNNHVDELVRQNRCVVHRNAGSDPRSSVERQSV